MNPVKRFKLEAVITRNTCSLNFDYKAQRRRKAKRKRAGDTTKKSYLGLSQTLREVYKK
jgi:hypothetical protein